MGAAVVAMVMGTGFLISAVYITVKMVKAKSWAREVKRIRRLKQRAGRAWRDETTKRFHYPNHGYAAADQADSDKSSLTESSTAKAIFNSPAGTPRYNSPNMNNGRMNSRGCDNGLWT